ncbi:MAG: competence/damage-inducible protein A [Alphaproteobacteria bacterium]
MTDQKPATAAVLIIGNEILSGRTQDMNLNYIAKGLAGIGVRLREARVVADVEKEVVDAVNACRAAYDYVFTTGGIGPTHDDITSPCVAKAFGVELHRHPEAVAAMEKAYQPGQLNAARLRMAEVPVGAELIKTSVTAAPGFRMGNVFVMAGVPSIMRAMFDAVKHGLRAGPPVLSRSIATHLPEGTIAADFAALQETFPAVDMGSYPFFRQGKFGTSLVLRATDEALLAKAVGELQAMIARLGGDAVEEPVP